MKKIAFAVVVAAALAAAGMAISSGPNEKLASQTRVYGGGTFSFTNGVARAFAIDAHVDGNGNGATYGTWEYGPPSGPWHVRGEITCLTVVGTTAIVGGYVTDTERPELAGLAFLTYVRDNGTQAAAAVDQGSLSYFGTSPDDFPTTFPQTCPSAPFDALPPAWFDVAGDVVVQQ